MNAMKQLAAKFSRVPAGALAAVLMAAALLSGGAASAQTLTVQVRPPVVPAAGTVSPTNVLAVTTVPQTFTVTAVESNPGYKFDHWEMVTNAQLNVFSVSTDPSVLIDVTSTNSPALVRAYFVPRGCSLVISAIPAAGGYTDPATGTNWFATNATVAVTATANPGYEFTGWGNAAVGNVNPVSLIMDRSKVLDANFAKLWTVYQYYYSGPSVLGPYTGVTARDGSNLTVAVSEPYKYVGSYRYRVNGYTNGVNIVPPSFTGGGITTCQIQPITTNVSFNWTWVKQWEVRVLPDTNGTARLEDLGPGDGDINDDWYDDGTTVTITMKAWDSTKFQPDYCMVNTTKYIPDANGIITPVAITGNTTIRPFFREAASSVLPSWFVTMWNLVPGAAGNGPNDDPDRDGLSNMQEASLSVTNKGWYYNPLDADTDGDGMDDGYEYGAIDPTNITDQTVAALRPAATDNGSRYEFNGPAGNPDADYHWDVTTGYEDKGWPLTNIEEYEGPDAAGPFTAAINFGATAYGIPYPFPSNPATARPTVYVLVTNALYTGDTGDQSKGNTPLTDRDVFDDGFEFSWDQWQQANSGMVETFELGVVNGTAMMISNTVPDWTVNRVFNPRQVYSQTAGSPDNDVLYDYLTGKVSAYYYTSAAEYNAWVANAFTPGVASAPHAIRMDLPPPGDTNPKRCSHPFLWDVDQDGLPDGYEVIFGYDPWSAVTPGEFEPDGQANPDGEWMAKDGANPLALRNHELYLRDGYDARVAIDQTYPVALTMPGPGIARSPTTEPYSNIDELRGPDGVMNWTPTPSADDATCPLNFDSDRDGIWDGWEAYVGLNPNSALDAGLDPDDDKLATLAEFQSFYTSSTNRGALVPLNAWLNKIFPTDPGADASTRVGAADTDGDGLKDGDEMTFFNGTSAAATNVVIDADNNISTQVFTLATWNSRCYTGGGLNPATWDTDDDTLPDPYEASYPVAIDGTLGDAFLDPDHDGLQNYQEYFSAAVWHWQYDAWLFASPPYDNAFFFMGIPFAWDWASPSGRQFIPLFGERPGTYAYNGSNPGLIDTDWDAMDDYYEIFHGLNPVYGNIDLVASRSVNAPIATSFVIGDPRLYPFVNGTPQMDSDGDGLPNGTEYANYTTPSTSPTHHTDPTPLWITDTGFIPGITEDPFDLGYSGSWVNLYYVPGSIWYWSGPFPPPIYAYDFESNEGYDTDNDGFSDYEELNVTQTDPLSPERPVKRRAMYFPPGLKAYCRSFPLDVPNRMVSERSLAGVMTTEDTFRSFTVEAWVRPLNPASGDDQVIVERSLMVPIGNPMGIAPGVRVNFRLAIDPEGIPYVSYTGDGQQIIFYEAKAPSTVKLSATNWVHLSGTYSVPSPTNPSQRGVLSLYVNGQLMRQTNPNELPAIGHFNEGSPVIVTYSGSIVVGAADLQPDAPMTGLGLGPLYTPSPTKFFKGWIDEVRVWDGARSAAAVATGMKLRMKQSDVLASRVAWETGAAVSPNTNPLLMCLYDFDNLADPDHMATAPAGLGFDLTGTAIYPADWQVSFWSTTSERSLVYTDYRYIPWIEDAASHTPNIPPFDIGDSNAVSVVVTGTNATDVTTRVLFPNTWDPYGWKHFTFNRYSPFAEARYGFVRIQDLLPLGWAAADEDIPMWDNGTVPATTPFDSDGDGMSDSYEEQNGLDPLAATGENGGNGDADGDGLSNIAEYRAGTNPRAFDSDGDGFGDYDSRPGPGFRTYGELFDDGDNIPDAWEALYQRICPSTGLEGLDPATYDADKDPDLDGWSNYAEYMGSWRAYVAMATSNGAGFVSNTNNMVMVPHCDPLDSGRYPEPLVALHVRYNGRLGSSLETALAGNREVRVSVYHTATMDGYPDATLNLKEDLDNDGIPDWWNDRYNATGSAADPDGDLLNNLKEFTHGTDPWNPDSDGDGVSDLGDYSASENQAGAVVRRFTTGHIREGNNYLFAYLDVNNDKQWQPDDEPAGIGQLQPVNLGWSDVNNVEIGLSDTMPGYPRFTWTASATASKYIVLSSSPAMTNVIQAPRHYMHEGDCLVNNRYGFPAGFPSFDVYANDLNHYVGTVMPPEITAYSLGTPSIITPHDTVFTYARSEVKFKLDANATSYRLQVSSSSNGTAILSVTNIVPFRDALGISRAPLPFYARDNYSPSAGAYASSTWTNGRYWIRVQAATPSASTLSPWSAINLNVQPPASNGASMISGDIYYFGKISHGYGGGQTSNLTMIVQAFQSAGFSGIADAQVQVSYQCNTNVPSARKGGYDLMGLRSGTYYVRAFIDVNGNRALDSWEPVGFASVPLDDHGYKPLDIDLSAVSGLAKAGVRIVIRDRDTDDDQLSDGWEWMYYGSLARGAYDTAANSWTLLRNYEIEPADLDPTKDDFDGDGALDTIEVDWTHAKLGMVPDPLHIYNPYDPVLNPSGTDLNPTKWDTDGDGLSDGYEINQGLDPLNPADGAAKIASVMAAGGVIPGLPAVSRIAAVTPGETQFTLSWAGQIGMSYEVQYSHDLKTWQAAPSGTRYGGPVIHTYEDLSPKVATRFYRVVVVK